VNECIVAQFFDSLCIFEWASWITQEPLLSDACVKADSGYFKHRFSVVRTVLSVTLIVTSCSAELVLLETYPCIMQYRCPRGLALASRTPVKVLALAPQVLALALALREKSWGQDFFSETQTAWLLYVLCLDVSEFMALYKCCYYYYYYVGLEIILWPCLGNYLCP